VTARGRPDFLHERRSATNVKLLGGGRGAARPRARRPHQGERREGQGRWIGGVPRGRPAPPNVVRAVKNGSEDSTCTCWWSRGRENCPRQITKNSSRHRVRSTMAAAFFKPAHRKVDTPERFLTAGRRFHRWHRSRHRSRAHEAGSSAGIRLRSNTGLPIAQPSRDLQVKWFS